MPCFPCTCALRGLVTFLFGVWQWQAIRDYKRGETPLGVPQQNQVEEEDDGDDDGDDEMTEEEEVLLYFQHATTTAFLLF